MLWWLLLMQEYSFVEEQHTASNTKACEHLNNGTTNMTERCLTLTKLRSLVMNAAPEMMHQAAMSKKTRPADVIIDGGTIMVHVSATTRSKLAWQALLRMHPCKTAR
jgi:hypothetical protein